MIKFTNMSITIANVYINMMIVCYLRTVYIQWTPGHPRGMFRAMVAVPRRFCQRRLLSFATRAAPTLEHLRHPLSTGEVFLVGTSHISAKSAAEARQMSCSVFADEGAGMSVD